MRIAHATTIANVTHMTDIPLKNNTFLTVLTMFPSHYRQVLSGNIRVHKTVAGVMSEKGRRNFIRLAERRVSRTIDEIRLIGNLSDRSNYEYDQDEVAKIFAALRSELNACRKRFEAARPKSRSTTFRLKDRRGS